MTSGRTKEKVPAKVLHDAQLLLDEVIGMLEPYFVILTREERQALLRKGAGSFKFLEMSHEFAVDYPELFPAFTEAAIFEEEFSIVRELWFFGNKLNQLKDSMSDMEMRASSHVLETAMAFYHTVKIAARHDIPGARVIYDELKLKFPCKSRQYRAKDLQLE